MCRQFDQTQDAIDTLDVHSKVSLAWWIGVGQTKAHLENMYIGRAYFSRWNEDIYDVPVLQELNNMHLLDQLLPYNNQEELILTWTAEYLS